MKFIGEVLGLIRREQYDEASKMLEEGYSSFLREDAAFFRNIPEEDLTEKLLQEHNYTNDHLEVLAELFNAEAELNMAQGNRPRAKEYFRKALLLLVYTDNVKRTYSSERLEKIEIIREKLSGL